MSIVAFSQTPTIEQGCIIFNGTMLISLKDVALYLTETYILIFHFLCTLLWKQIYSCSWIIKFVWT